jgi:hypothetical protein
MTEYDELGRDAFLARYGYGPARSFFVVHDGKRYDSKALVGIAVGKQFPASGPLTASDFSGGEATVKAKLGQLGIEVAGPLLATKITARDISLFVKADPNPDTATSQVKSIRPTSELQPHLETLGSLSRLPKQIETESSGEGDGSGPTRSNT